MPSDVACASSDFAECYFSPLAHEADLAELVELFVADLPARLMDIQRAANAENWAEVGRLAHQLKGAGGSYGFPQISNAALKLERAARDGMEPGSVISAVDQLAGECARTRAGIPNYSTH